MHNDRMIVPLKTWLTLFLFVEVSSARGLLLAVVFMIMRSERSVVKSEMNYLMILSNPVHVLPADRYPIRKNLPTFRI